MPESLQHAGLVKDLCRYISDEYLQGDKGSLLRDSLGISSNDRCHEINGYIPDVIARIFKGPIQCVLGEAKTSRDIETKHTARQLESYLDYCSQITNNALLVVAVPWAYHRLARQIICVIVKRKKFDISKVVVPAIFKA